MARAREFLEVAELVVDEKDEDASFLYASSAASLAVLAGIAASDAACCKALQERSRSENHRDAAQGDAPSQPAGRFRSRGPEPLIRMIWPAGQFSDRHST